MTPRMLPLLLIVLIAAAPLALADDGVVKLDRQVVVIGNDGDETTVRVDGDRLRIVTREHGDLSVHEFDLSGLGALIDEAVASAMEGLDGVFDQDFSVTVDNDHMIHVKQGDRACGFDTRVLARELQRSLGSLRLDIRRELDHHGGVEVDIEQDEMANLEAELDRLKAELKSLRDDLDRVR